MPFNRFKPHFEEGPNWRDEWQDVVLPSEGMATVQLWMQMRGNAADDIRAL